VQPRLQGAVRVDSIAVKDENLAAHLKAPDFFDTERYPELGFTSTAVNVGEDGRLEVNATLPKGGFALDNDVQLQVSLELVREA
jgi:polyisoprenoid-binding protein YceI